MEIYFAGSIRGGRQDKELYLEIINHLKNHGEVLTEHIGNKKLTDFGETDFSDKEIYERDVKWVEESDVIVAEVSTPSLGVGYEIALAEKLGKKILCLYKISEGKRLSPMVSGNKKIFLKEYRYSKEIFSIIDEFFKTIKQN